MSIFAQFRQLRLESVVLNAASRQRLTKSSRPLRRRRREQERKFDSLRVGIGEKGEMVRFKHRYLLVSLVFPSTLPNPLAITPVVPVEKSPFINESGLISLLRDSLSVNFGDVGAGEVGGTFTS